MTLLVREVHRLVKEQHILSRKGLVGERTGIGRYKVELLLLQSLLGFIRRTFKGIRGGQLGIGLLVGLMDIATANNTVAIVMAGPIAREVSEDYGIDPRQTASLLDTCSCILQGIIPYGAQLLIAAGLSGVSSLTLIPWLFYPFLLAVFVLISIARAK